MSIDFSYLLRKGEAEPALRELDDVVLLAPVISDEGEPLPVGHEGTVVGVWRAGEAYVVEFAGSSGVLATVRPQDLRRIGRHAA